MKNKLIITIVGWITGILLFGSCSTDEGLDNPFQIEGEWKGVHSYYNPVSGTKFAYLNVNFNSSSSGSLTYDSPTDYRVVYFTYKVEKSNIICKGYTASTDNPSATDFNLNIKIEGDRLYPQSPYQNFILTRDGSIETDVSGNIIIDDSELIEGVWINDDGSTVLDINGGHYTEYILVSPFSKVYSRKINNVCFYDYREKYITFFGSRYEVETLNTSELILKNSVKTIIYRKGTVSDIPSNGVNGDTQTRQTILEAPLYWKTDNNKIHFAFHSKGKATYLETGPNLGSYGNVVLSAVGTYTLSSDKILCEFNEVSWEAGNSQAKDFFPDWSYGKINIKEYNIEKLTSESLIIITPERYRLIMKPFQ